MSAIARAAAVIGVGASILGVGLTGSTSAATSSLPTLKLALDGRTVAVSGPLQSGAVNVV